MEQLALAIFASLLSAGAWLWVLRRFDRIEPEPLGLLLRTGLVGGLVSALVAGFLNDRLFSWLGITFDAPVLPWVSALVPALFAGLNEESCKLMATLWLTHRQPEVDEPIDPMIYAMSVALGFAAFENILYMIHYGPGVIVLRSLLTVPGHLTFAALWGYGLARARFGSGPGRYRLLIVTVFLGGIAHAAYDFFLFPRTWIALFVIPLLAGLVWLANRRLTFLVGQTPYLEAGECPDCFAPNLPDTSHCRQCGSSLAQHIYTLCPHCNAKVLPGSLNCHRCKGELARVFDHPFS